MRLLSTSRHSCREFALKTMRRCLVGMCTVHLCGGAVDLRAEGRRDVAWSGLASLVTGAPEHLQRVADTYEAGTGPFVEIIPIEPTVVAQLKQALALMEEAPLPEHLIEAAEWLGKSEAARGKALRGLLRAASRVVRSRGPVSVLPSDEPFPRFRSPA